jgi:Transposase domain (DUF772)
MRGEESKQVSMYSYVTLAQRIPADHPVRGIRDLVDRALARMDVQLEQLYSSTGRPSIAPERLLRASLLMVLYSIRSERQLMEQMNYNLCSAGLWVWIQSNGMWHAISPSNHCSLTQDSTCPRESFSTTAFVE